MASQPQTQQARRQTPVRKRVIHQLDTPLSTVQWPPISPENQDSIVALLCTLLTPIGNHRESHVKRSKGRKAKSKAKREAKKEDLATDAAPSDSVPPEPPIARHIDVGFNAITSNITARSSKTTDSSAHPPRAYAAVFVAQADQPPAFHCHFPQMIGAACRDMPDETKTRLVGLPKGCYEKLSDALALPRVSSVALEADAPGAAALQEFVRRTVPVVDVSWLVGGESEYRPTKINAIETTVGAKRVRHS